jgi:hypothetical protein
MLLISIKEPKMGWKLKINQKEKRNPEMNLKIGESLRLGNERICTYAV